MINRQLFTMKFMSSRLKKFNYNITIDYNLALQNKEIIALSDNQILRSIRDILLEKADDKEDIKKRILDRTVLEEFYTQLEILKKKKNTEKNIKLKQDIKQQIVDMCFVPEYITIVIEDESHYDYIYKNGLKINGNTYFRISSSAGQGRKSTVVFCSDEILETLNKILDNGRDKNKKFSPSKFNAYKGTYGSATKVVTTPTFCVVPDYCSKLSFDVNWVTETEGEQDDNIETKNITRDYNRWDGMGLISPELAKIWAKDLGLDYIPAEFCIRQSYVKGMLCVFDFKEFCRTENNGEYLVKSIYKDENGNNIKVDLRKVDIIITESQFKLWDSYISLESYIENCEKHNLKWGVALYTDKVLKDNIKMNYQFLQVLDIKNEDIPKLCEKFVDWIMGVNSDNIWYTLLFLMGCNLTKESIDKYLKTPDNYWVKSLIVNHDLINDKYIKQKVYNLIKKKIDSACMGSIILDGNNQTLVSDPYGMMEYLCGKEVKGLLEANEYYSCYWSNKGVKTIVGMRPPLTYRSEVTELNLVNEDKHRKWYKYLYGGIIVNIHGHETDNWAGSDWDFDFLSTTSNETVIKSRYKNELPVAYEAPKPDKIVFTDEDLFKADKFTFGSIIGAITNKSTSGYALLKWIEEIYGIDSREYEVTLKRIKMCTKLQSAQIDKAKIGRNVKGIPKTWTDRKYIESLDEADEEKEFLKRIMLDRHPYFFTHLYADTRRKYKKYIEEENLSSIHKFGIGIQGLINKENKTEDEIEYIKKYYDYMPIIDSDSVMNLICKYLENINFDIRINANKKDEDIHLILMRNENIVNEDTYKKVLEVYKKLKKEIRVAKTLGDNNSRNKYEDDKKQLMFNIKQRYKDEMDKVCSNTYELVDYLIYIYYVQHPSDNKDLLWDFYGDVILKNLVDKNQNPILFPFPIESDTQQENVIYLNKKYRLEEITI